MVRRHRILDDELKYIVYACYRRFVTLIADNRESPETEYLFKFLWRVTKHRKGNPHYPKLDPRSITQLIMEMEKKFNISSYLKEELKK